MASTALAVTSSAWSLPAHAQQATGEQTATTQKQDRVQPEGKEQATTFLDLITISATMGLQAVIDAMSGTSVVDSTEIRRSQPNTAADMFRTVPGVSASMNGDDPATAINIRGLEQYGRVAVTLDGARQDYWRVGHGSGSFYIEPELLKQVTVIRGPVSNAYGTGGIGGVVAFETKSAGDFLREGETWALSEKGRYESNGDGWLTSTTGAYRPNENIDVIGNIVWRNSDEYDDGNGTRVRYTGEEALSGYGKVTLRPAEGHELKLSAIAQNYDDIVSASSGSNNPNVTRYDADTKVRNYTANYTYKPDDNAFWDFSATAYHAATRAEQTQIVGSAVGSMRYYDVTTTGINAHNASRFDAAGMSHTLTYGGDYSVLDGDSKEANFGKGKQYASGAFLQWEGKYDTWLDVIGAVRYDRYQLDGMSKPAPGDPSHPVSLEGERWSPRFTVGVTPFEGMQFYGTYAEGYRTPHMQDVFRQNGAHGSTGYEPNLLLKPEVASTWEAGVNMKYDDVFTGGDTFRAKVNLFHTKVDDYIDTVSVRNPGPPVVTTTSSQNVGTALLKGIELEGVYDYGWGFINLAASFASAKMDDGPNKGSRLNNTPLDNVAVTLGFRALEDRLVYGIQWQSLGEVERVITTAPFVKVYPRTDLVNVFANWDVNDNLKLDFGVDNIFNKAYTDPQSSWGSNPLSEQGKGRTFKIALTGRIGG